MSVKELIEALQFCLKNGQIKPEDQVMVGGGGNESFIVANISVPATFLDEKYVPQTMTMFVSRNKENKENDKKT